MTAERSAPDRAWFAAAAAVILGAILALGHVA